MSFIKTEYDVQQKISSILDGFVKKAVKFNEVSLTSVKMNYGIEYRGRKRYADIAVVKDDSHPLVVIETKKKYVRGAYSL